MTLFEPNATSSLFSLPSLESTQNDQPFQHSFPALKQVKPQFALPRLDEYAAGRDRMLVGLEEGVWWGMRPSSVGTIDIESKLQAKGSVSPAGDQTIADDGAAAKRRTEGMSEWDKMAERMGMDQGAGPSRPRAFKPIPTWDSVDEGVVENPFASESGRAIFEGITILEDLPLALPSLRARPQSAPADPDELLRLLLRATMGTTTTEALKWDRKRAAYTWGGGNQRALGLSRISTAAAVQDFLDIATALRRLDQLLDQQSKSPLTPTHHALFHAVSTYLTFIKNRLSSAVAESAKEALSGWIRWKASLREVGDLLKLLLEIMGWSLAGSTAAELPSRPSTLLTHIYSHLLAQYQTSLPTSPASPTVLCLAYLLQSSSAPFLKLLHAWVGLSDTPAELGATGCDDQPWADLGITRAPRKSAGSAGEVAWEYEFSSRRMPAFIPKESRRKLFEAGRSLRLLREANGDHPLSGGRWGLEGSWGWGAGFTDVHVDVRSHVKRIQRDIERWRRAVRHRSRPLSGGTSSIRLKYGKKERQRLPLEFFNPSSSPKIGSGRVFHPLAEPHPTEHDEEGPAAVKTVDAEKQLSDFLNMLNLTPGTQTQASQSTSLWSSSPLDALHSFLSYHSNHPILPPSYPTFPLFISHHLLAPLLAHAELVSAALVSLYIDDLHLTDHLDILQSFWLGGDAGFFERVSTALFGREDQEVGIGANMGRGDRTRARMGIASGALREGADGGEWGIALGVGLSDRQRWPPGGAELAYALRTTLLDDAGGHTGDVRDGKAWSEVEDRVSFAIRPLPEDEDGIRAKWMDPQAIEALDFLYLSYTPPPAMSVVLPRAVLAKYQTINNFLLRLCRVNAVVRSMFHDLHKPQTNAADSVAKSGVDHSRPRSRSQPTPRPAQPRTVFSSDPALGKTVHHLRFRMSHFISALMRYIVDSAIGSNFDRMRRRLEKLKRKEETSGTGRPSTPGDDGYSDFGVEDPPALRDEWAEDDDHHLGDPEGGADGDDEPIHQLRSIHSLVAHHHITLDKILRACMLSSSPAYDVAYKLLMRLCGLVLDLGKVVKQTESGMVKVEEAREKVLEVKKEWEEKEKVFMIALDRLSQNRSKTDKPIVGDVENDERDLELLMDGDEGEGHSGQSGGLGELLLRLRLGYGDEGARAGRSNDSI